MRVLVRESLECWIVRALIDLKLVALEFFLSLTIVSALSRRTPIFLSLLPACVRAALLLGVPSPLASFATRDGLADSYPSLKTLKGLLKCLAHCRYFQSEAY
jgi:hypothetical protein